MALHHGRKPPQSPPLFTGTSQSVIEDTKRLISRSKNLQDAIVADHDASTVSFNNVLLPMAMDDNKMGTESHILCFYQSVSSDQGLRDASTEAEKLFDDFGIESSMREDVFNLVDAVFKKESEAATLDPESQRLLEKDRKGYIKSGLGLPVGTQRDRFKEIQKRLSELTIQFQKTLNEEKGGLWFAPVELDGVPADVLDSLKKGTDENEGKIRLTFKYPDLFPALKYAKSAEARKRIFLANENKCSSNIPLLRETLILRDEAARLLGYKDHAHYRIEDKMAKTPETVDRFLGDLRQRLGPGGDEEVKKLKDLKISDMASRGLKDEYDGHYYLWDHRFYDRLLLEKEHSLDQQLIAEYFPLSTTIVGMLKIFEELFGLSFVEITGSDMDAVSETGKGGDIIWHQDVQLFSVWNDDDAGGDFVGYIYFDLFPRENKYGHAANFNLQPGYIKEDGTRRYPATALVCNFPKPTEKKPSLLRHDDVVTLFHELGHGVHDLVSRTKYARFHGTNTVRDFVEAPSQMLENWCWTASQLKTLSKHYSYLAPEYKAGWLASAAAGEADSKRQEPERAQPAERIPDELLEKLISTKHVNAALFNLRQLHFGIFDMTIHQPEDHEAIEKLSVSETYNRLRKEIAKLDGPEVVDGKYDWANGQASFGHLVGGYDAGYYGYLSSEVYSTDMFYSVFKQNPMNRSEGRRYRHTVLERGGSQDEMQTLVDFLGRKPDTDAFYKELGLVK